MSERRYRDKQSRPIPIWNGVLEHRKRIDAAIWVFLWLVDAITGEKDGFGVIRGGAPVKVQVIAVDLAFDERTVRQHLQALEDRHYIRRRRTPYGYVIEVCNSRKFGIWQGHKRSEENARSEGKRSEEIPGQTGRLCTQRSEENARNKEDAAKNAAVDAAAAAQKQSPTSKPEDSVWSFLTVKPCGPISFRTLLESRWASRNGDRPSVVIGETIDAWEAAEGRVPPKARPLFQALEELRRREKQDRRDRQGAIHEEKPIREITAEEIPA